MRAKVNIRSTASSFVRKYRWLPAAVALSSGGGLVFAVAVHAGSATLLALVMTAFVTAYSWGYAERALRRTQWPLLDDLGRREYAEVWNALTPTPWQAAEAACGERDETRIRESGLKSFRELTELLLLTDQQDVLEIGCGIGRVGFALAPHCRSWTGADISAHMLAYASSRLGELNNVRLIRLQGVGLGEFRDNSFHVVYTTDMFEHLEEIDRWRYVEEAFRVLRPGGCLYIDNIDLESDGGWDSFIREGRLIQDQPRPPYLSRLSTAAELIVYVTRAGFERVASHRRPPLVVVTAAKPVEHCGSPHGGTGIAASR